MADTLTLSAKTRTTEVKPQVLRRAGEVPAVVYGFGVENTSIALDRKNFWRVYAAAGGNTLVELTIDDKAPIKVLIQDVQLNPVHDEPIHADFYAVNLKETVQTEIPLSFIGDSPAVVDLGIGLDEVVQGLLGWQEYVVASDQNPLMPVQVAEGVSPKCAR